MMLKRRTFALSELKAAGAEKPGIFTGKASVYGVVDSYGDVVMPGAFTKTLAEHGGTFKVLSQHNPEDVIGLATLADSTDALLVTEGMLELDLQSAKDAYTRVKAGLIDGISIGYVTRDAVYQNGLRMIKDIDLWEISLVTFPANEYARVTSMKGQGMVELKDQERALLVENALVAMERCKSLMQAAQDEIKAGRVISASNAKMIKAIHENLKCAHELSSALIGKIGDESGDGDGDGDKNKESDEEKASRIALEEMIDAVSKLKL